MGGGTRCVCGGGVFIPRLSSLPKRLSPSPHRSSAVGTIFGIYKAKNPGSGNYSLEDVMRVGGWWVRGRG